MSRETDRAAAFPLLTAEQVAEIDCPARAQTVWIVTAWHAQGAYWRVWGKRLWGSQEAAEEMARGLHGCWTNRRVLKVALR